MVKINIRNYDPISISDGDPDIGLNEPFVEDGKQDSVQFIPWRSSNPRRMDFII